MLKILVCLSILVPSVTIAQWQIPRYQWEAGATITALHHHKCELDDKSWHQELTSGFGIRLNYNWHYHWALAGGLYFDHLIGQNKMCTPSNSTQVILKYKSSLGQRLPYLFLNVEGGVEYTFRSRNWNLPFYVGLTYLCNGNVDLFIRVKSPHLYSSTTNESFKIMENRIEVGIALNPKWNDHAKFEQYSGNPFILRSF